MTNDTQEAVRLPSLDEAGKAIVYWTAAAIAASSTKAVADYRENEALLASEKKNAECRKAEAENAAVIERQLAERNAIRAQSARFVVEYLIKSAGRPSP